MNVRNAYISVLAVCCCLGWGAPVVVFAGAVYEPLVGIPGVNATANFGDYINALYYLSISIAALIAVVKIILAGVQYMLSDIVTQKSDAKNDIRTSLLGLLLIISAVVILTTVNPDLQNLNVFRNGPPITPGRQGLTTPEAEQRGRQIVSTGQQYVTTAGSNGRITHSFETIVGECTLNGNRSCIPGTNPEIIDRNNSGLAAFQSRCGNNRAGLSYQIGREQTRTVDGRLIRYIERTCTISE